MAASYDHWYASPAGRAHDLAQKSDVRRFVGPAATAARALDVGCGTGHWGRFLAGLGYAVVGVDISPSMLESARLQPECREAYLLADAAALPFQDASFELVTTMAAIEFMRDAPRALREIFRCVRPGGQGLVGTLNRCAPMNERRVSEGRQPYASAHLFSPGELCELLRPYGKVRLTASAPERRFTAGGMDGPFLVAEVRR